MLKPQDVAVLLKLMALPERQATYARLASELEMSASEVHAALKRAVHSRLARRQGESIRPIAANLREFLVHGLSYAFPPELGGLTRGMPTRYAAAPLRSKLRPGDEPPPVWPDPDGEAKGLALLPLYPRAAKAARKDSRFHELLALADALRAGQARERELAVQAIDERFGTNS